MDKKQDDQQPPVNLAIWKWRPFDVIWLGIKLTILSAICWFIFFSMSMTHGPISSNKPPGQVGTRMQSPGP